ncbi:RNA metabolism protein [Lithospermum erythrorhizon]|uniref:RNA metabolism protein n=1 Tax=Lithospermum erythrorhizon TaxID=34254 RepID=A0AAV3NL11_LITER
MATASNPTPPPTHHSPRPSATTTTNVTHRSPRPRRSSVPRVDDSSPWTQIVIGIESNSDSTPSYSSLLHTNNAASLTATVGPAGPVPQPHSCENIQERIVEHSTDQQGEKSVSGDVGIFSSVLKEEGVISDSLSGGLENGGSSDGGKRPVWNKPAPSDVVSDVSPLVGVSSWPALSELTKGSPKSSSSDSPKCLPEGSSFVPQLTGMSSSSSQRKGINMKTNSSSQTNHTVPTRQRSFRQGNGGGSGNPRNNMTTNGGFSLELTSQRFGVESAPNNTGRPANSESLSEGNPHREGGGQRGGFVPQSNSGSEHQQRNSYRRGSGGPNPRGDGSHYHNHGGRRDQPSGNQDRNSHRNFGGRGAHMQPQRGSSRPFIRGPPHANTSYVPPPIPMHPSFGAPMVYPGPEVFYFPGPHQDPFRPGPMVPPMGPMFYPFVDPLLHTKIVNQIEYYFSTENLVGDTYLRKNMDEQGWVSIKLIAGFKKVSQLTDNIQLIMASLQASSLLEIEGEKMRRRDDWQRSSPGEYSSR